MKADELKAICDRYGITVSQEGAYFFAGDSESGWSASSAEEAVARMLETMYDIQVTVPKDSSHALTILRLRALVMLADEISGFHTEGDAANEIAVLPDASQIIDEISRRIKATSDPERFGTLVDLRGWIRGDS